MKHVEVINGDEARFYPEPMKDYGKTSFFESLISQLLEKILVAVNCSNNKVKYKG